MAKVRVPLHGKPQGYATVDTAATEGAIVGQNLWWPDGSVVTEAALSSAAVLPDQGEPAIVYWRTIQEIPANVQAVAALAANGFVRRSGDAWTAAPIGNADLSGASTSGLAEGSNLYFTAERAREAAVADSINPGVSNVAPSQRAVAAAIDAIELTPGPPGKDGQIRYTGNGPPGVIVGAEPGDTYMDLITGDIFKLT